MKKKIYCLSPASIAILVVLGLALLMRPHGYVQDEFLGFRFHHLVLSEEPITVECKLLESDSLFLEFDSYNSTIFDLEIKKHEGVKIDEIYENEVLSSLLINKEGPGEAKVTLVIDSKFYRGKIEPRKVRFYNRELEYSRELERCLEQEIKEGSIVKKVADQIRKGLPSSRQNNPYFLIKAAVHWFEKNIEFSLVPKYFIDEFAVIIESMPKEKQSNHYQLAVELRRLLKKIAPEDFKELIDNPDFMDDEFLTRLSKALGWNVYLINAPDSYSKSKLFLNRVGEACPLLRLLVWRDKDEGAEEFLRTKMGRCVNTSQALMAISRLWGIPAKLVHGWYEDFWTRGHHAWVVVWLCPYGWVEVDPTNGRFYKFPYRYYAYDIFFSKPKEGYQIRIYTPKGEIKAYTPKG